MYIFFTIIIIIDILHLIISINSIYYYQNFSTEHPQKGEIVNYKLTIENRLSIIPCFINLSLNKELNIDQRKIKIKTFSNNYIKSNFTLPYRGIYNIGIKNIKYFDLLNIICFENNIWPRTFYVYPKINKDLNIENIGNGYLKDGKNKENNNFSDFIETIDKYNNSCKMSHISWKHFAAYGTPYVKKFYSKTSSNCNIFLETTDLISSRLGPVDDIAIETMLSIIQININNKISTVVNSQDKPINNLISLLRLQKEAINITFNKTKEDSYKEFTIQNYNQNEQLFLIMSNSDSKLLDLDIIKKYKKLTIIIITNRMSEKNKNIILKTTKKFSELVDIKCID